MGEASLAEFVAGSSIGLGGLMLVFIGLVVASLVFMGLVSTSSAQLQAEDSRDWQRTGSRRWPVGIFTLAIIYNTLVAAASVAYLLGLGFSVDALLIMFLVSLGLFVAWTLLTLANMMR